MNYFDSIPPKRPKRANPSTLDSSADAKKPSEPSPRGLGQLRENLIKKIIELAATESHFEMKVEETPGDSSKSCTVFLTFFDRGEPFAHTTVSMKETRR